MYTGMVLIDLQKAFDTVDHKILLEKLQSIGADDIVISWFRSYLCNREQFVDIHGVKSSCSSITCGVPQGSILGPMLFLLYVNDMSNAVKCDLMLYADDSALIVNGKSVHEIESKLCNELDKVSTWLESNKLSLHLGKTESILFGSKKRLKAHSDLDIVCKGRKIESKDHVKYLGAILDNDMSGKSMGLSSLKKINKCLKFMYRKASFLDFRCRKMLCQALLQSHFDYACNIWYRSLDKQHVKKFQCAQNKIIRYIYGYEARHHLLFSDFCKLNLLDVKSRVDYLSINTMFKIFHESAPHYLVQSVNFNVTTHNTRMGSKTFVIPQVKSQGLKSFVYNGIKLWNGLPSEIKDIDDKDKFKLKCKSLLLNRMKRSAESDYVI